MSVYIRLVYWRAIFARVRVVVAAHYRTTDVDFDSSSRLETTTTSRVQTATESHTALHVSTSTIIILVDEARRFADYQSYSTHDNVVSLFIVYSRHDI